MSGGAHSISAASRARRPYRRLLVAGPDGRSFVFTDVPAGATVGAVAAEIAGRYRDGTAVTAQLAVVDHVGAGGTGRRLNPESTLHAAGVTDGSRLRVAFRRQAAV